MTTDRSTTGLVATPPRLHEVKPRELTGRDTIARFEVQFRASALAALEILKNTGIDRVYCDFQEDFVVRDVREHFPIYHFYQVKTKRKKKHQWSQVELFGLPKNLPPRSHEFFMPGGSIANSPSSTQKTKILGSFVGHLIELTISFGDSCGTATFLTNAFLADDVEETAQAIAEGRVDHPVFRYLADHFESIFPISSPPGMSMIHGWLRKLRIDAGHAYLDPYDHDFETRASKTVFEFSEIDLMHTESVELVDKLLSLVRRKSMSKVHEKLSSGELDELAGVSIDDLLDLLPVSRGAYTQFLASGDSSALKHASILQRKLGQAKASEEMITAASRWKIDWDNWFRTYRHAHESQVMTLQNQLYEIYAKWSGGHVSFSDLASEIASLHASLGATPLGGTLTLELLSGGVMAELVRSESR